MAVPKKRTSVSRKGLRWAGHTFKIQPKSTMSCSNCGGITMMHRICPTCGHYRGKQLIQIKTKPVAETETATAE